MAEPAVSDSFRSSGLPPPRPTTPEQGVVSPLLILLAGLAAGPWSSASMPWAKFMGRFHGGSYLPWLVAHDLWLLGGSAAAFFLAVFLYAGLGWGKRFSALLSGLFTLHLGLHWTAWVVVHTPYLLKLFTQVKL